MPWNAVNMEAVDAKAVNAAKTQRKCEKCPLEESAEAFRDIEGNPNRKCYVCQITCHVIEERKDLSGSFKAISEQLRSEVKSNAKVMLQQFEHARRQRKPDDAELKFYSKRKLMSRIDESLDEKQRKHFRDEGPAGAKALALNAIREEPEGGQLRSANTPDGDEIAYESGSSSALSHSPVDFFAPHQSKGATSSRSMLTASGNTTSFAAEGANSKSGISNNATGQPSRSCKKCDEVKHWAYFVSPQKKDRAALECLNCRLANSVDAYAKTTGNPIRYGAEREPAVQEAMAQKVDVFLGQWKNHMVEHDAPYFETQSWFPTIGAYELNEIYKRVRIDAQQMVGEKWDELRPYSPKHQDVSSPQAKRKVDSLPDAAQHQMKKQRSSDQTSNPTRPRRTIPDRNQEGSPTSRVTGQLHTPTSVEMPRPRTAHLSSPSSETRTDWDFRKGRSDHHYIQTTRSNTNLFTLPSPEVERLPTPELERSFEYASEEFYRAIQGFKEVKSSKLLIKRALEGQVGKRYKELLLQAAPTLKPLSKFFEGLQALYGE